jgi:hypothetical protein
MEAKPSLPKLRKPQERVLEAPERASTPNRTRQQLARLPVRDQSDEVLHVRIGLMGPDRIDEQQAALVGIPTL